MRRSLPLLLLPQACIVRIMKSSKRMKHSELLQEVVKQLAPRFAPTPADIKKRIEALIERDYLDREADLKTYNYLVRRSGPSLAVARQLTLAPSPSIPQA